MAYSCSFTSMFLILLFSVLCFSSHDHCYCYALDDDDQAAASTPPSSSYHHPPGDSSVVIRETCKNLIYYDLCVTSLGSDPRSFTVNGGILPFISLQLSLKNITDTKAYIQQLLIKNSSGGGGVTLKDTLKHCEESYGFAIQSVKLSKKHYHRQMFRGLIKNVNFARRNVTGCEKEIEKNSDLSLSFLYPLMQKNTLPYQLLTISYDLGKILVHPHDD